MTKDDIKVLIINESLRLGGAESMSVELANALIENDVKTYFTSASGPLKERLNKNIDFFEIPKFSIFSVKKIIDSLSKIISMVKPNIIHSQGATLSILAGISAYKIRLNPVKILTHHSRKFTRLPSFLSVYLLNKYCDHIIAISQSKYNELAQMKVFPSKISLIPNFVDCSQINRQVNSFNRRAICQKLNIPEGSYVIIMIGRLIPSKRFDKFIKILAQCSEKLNKKVTGLIIGDGPERKNLEQIAISYSNKVKILFLGYQNNIYKYLSISNLFLFPSEYEVLPMALIEASAMGVPVVCSNIPGNNDIVKNGYSGFLVSDSEEEYSNYILKILNDRNLALKISNNEIKIVKEKFDKGVVVNNIISLYKKLIIYEK